MDASFLRYGPAEPAGPIVLSVPHAGRDYPAALRANLAVPAAQLTPLEDRHADTLLLAARDDQVAFVQHRARAWIDLNRAEDERDPRVDEGAPQHPIPPSAVKLRSGLGLVPRRVGRVGELWRRRFSAADIADRIAADHRPYHAALAAELERTRARFGIAVLLDVHSMPPLTEPAAAQIVIGDRFGQSAAARFVARIEGAAAPLRTALNTPYAGGHILVRHADPAAGIHALQLEIDRRLYLDRRFDRPGPGFTATVTMLRRVIAALSDEAFAAIERYAQAAE